jgi:hypothetical protein
MANLFDAANAPTSVPTEFYVGDFVQFKITTLGSDYPNTDFTARLVSRIATGASSEFTVTATASDSDYLFTILSSTTAGFTPNHYHWQIEIERNSDNERIIVDRGHWDISTDYDENVDPRSHNEIMLQKLESLLEGKADSDVSSYSIAGRSLNKLGPAELLDWRDYYKREVASEKRAEAIKHGRRSKSTILARF